MKTAWQILLVLVLFGAACSSEPSPELGPLDPGSPTDAGRQHEDAPRRVDVGADAQPRLDASRDATSPDLTADAAPDDVTEAPALHVLWMAPDGDDSRDGQTPERAVQSLERIQEILVADPPTTDVEVRIASGTYHAQTVIWTFHVPDHSITFTRVTPDDARPIFDGCTRDGACPGGTWFRLRRSDGAETRLVFNYLQVQNYQTAISLEGNRNAEASSNGSNRIYGCYFDRIGNVFNPDVNPSTAAVRLVNSDDNEIANNHFVDVINTRSGGLIHAIYVAHMSDRNEIARNRFYRSTGDPVRVRDYSNDNVIVDNRFIQVGVTAGYTEWYCDHDARDDCTKVGPECPSWGNQFRRNELDGTWTCDALGTFHYYQDDQTSGCAPPSPDARRLRTSENVATATPCSGI